MGPGSVTIRVGIVGCGWIGGAHSRAIKAMIDAGLVDARVVATCDAVAERAEAFAAAHNADLATTDPGSVFATTDAVWICTPTGGHRALVESAASARVAIYCEKPLATTFSDARAMTDAVRRAGVINQVGLVLRAASPIVALRDLVADPDRPLGTPMTAILRDDQYFPIQGQYVTAGGGSWRAEAEQAGGGALLEHSIHDLDVLAWLFGPVAEVACRTSNFAGHAGIEDVGVATLVHDSGVVSSLVTVWHDLLSRPSTRRLEVFGKDGFAWLDREDAGPVHVETQNGTYDIDADVLDSWAGQLPLPGAARRGIAPYALAGKAFLDAVAAGRPAAPDFDVALQAHAVADAAYRSAAAGGAPVRLAR